MSRKILVTGGSGFIGTNLISYFIANGDNVLNIDIKSPRNQAHMNYWEKVDILDEVGLQKSIKKFQPDVIIHMAARTDLAGKSLDEYLPNTVGVSNLLSAVKKLSSLKRLIFASSRLVCRIGYQPKNEFDYCPTTPYGESKVVGEKIVREGADQISCPWVIVRPTSIWGPWFDTPYKEFFLSVLNSRYVHPAGKRIRKSFGYVGNSVYIIDKILQCDETNIDKKTLYLSDYPPIEVKAWADLILKLSGKTSQFEVPLFVMKMAALFGDFLQILGWKNPPLTSFRLNNLLTEMLHDTTEIEVICGDLPYSLEESVKQTLAWLGKKV